ncbi:MAG: hypothetical protein HY719_13505 [Planctomycetes bacterium]|nr:hypothetical protein [Planctomycetota bacterium]
MNVVQVFAPSASGREPSACVARAWLLAAGLALAGGCFGDFTYPPAMYDVEDDKEYAPTSTPQTPVDALARVCREGRAQELNKVLSSSLLARLPDALPAGSTAADASPRAAAFLRWRELFRDYLYTMPSLPVVAERWGEPLPNNPGGYEAFDTFLVSFAPFETGAGHAVQWRAGVLFREGRWLLDGFDPSPGEPPPADAVASVRFLADACGRRDRYAVAALTRRAAGEQPSPAATWLGGLIAPAEGGPSAEETLARLAEAAGRVRVISVGPEKKDLEAGTSEQEVTVSLAPPGGGSGVGEPFPVLLAWEPEKPDPNVPESEARDKPPRNPNAPEPDKVYRLASPDFLDWLARAASGEP